MQVAEYNDIQADAGSLAALMKGNGEGKGGTNGGGKDGGGVKGSWEGGGGGKGGKSEPDRVRLFLLPRTTCFSLSRPYL